MLILGIETSCDETAAAVVADGRDVLSSVVATQFELHAQYGGVVPEIAARRHLRKHPAGHPGGVGSGRDHPYRPGRPGRDPDGPASSAP